jgi:hypothetical protein
MNRIRQFRDWSLSNWPIKLTALVLATVLWAVTAAQETTSQLVPVSLALQAPDGRAFTSELPPVQVRFAGTLRELIKLYETPPTIHKSIPDTMTGTSYVVELSTDDIAVIENATVIAQEVQPRSFTVTLDDAVQRRVRVASRVRVNPDSGFARFGDITVLPASVTVQGPEARVAELQSISTAPLDTNRVRSPVTIRVPLDTTGLAGVRIDPMEVVVSAEVGPVSERVIMGVAVRLPDPSRPPGGAATRWDHCTGEP